MVFLIPDMMSLLIQNNLLVGLKSIHQVASSKAQFGEQRTLALNVQLWRV